MDIVALIFGGFFILIVVIVAAALAMKFNGVKTINPPQGVAKQSTPPATLPADFEREIERLVTSGQLIEAIKLCRNVTGGDLKTAKEMVENMSRSQFSASTAAAFSAARDAVAENAAVNQQVLALLQAGQKIEAIKLYRKEYRTGLKEAKEAVERMVASLP